MAFTFRLERVDGTPAERPTFRTVVPNWRPGDTIRSAGASHSASSKCDPRAGETKNRC
jgi:hypothetical protein